MGGGSYIISNQFEGYSLCFFNCRSPDNGPSSILIQANEKIELNYCSHVKDFTITRISYILYANFTSISTNFSNSKGVYTSGFVIYTPYFNIKYIYSNKINSGDCYCSVLATNNSIISYFNIIQNNLNNGLLRIHGNVGFYQNLYIFNNTSPKIIILENKGYYSEIINSFIQFPIGLINNGTTNFINCKFYFNNSNYINTFNFYFLSTFLCENQYQKTSKVFKLKFYFNFVLYLLI